MRGEREKIVRAQKHHALKWRVEKSVFDASLLWNSLQSKLVLHH